MEKNSILNSRYQVKTEIGSGGMAKVYAAYDLYLKRDVAIKIIDLNKSIDNMMKSRFMQEINAISRIRHPNVCLVYDIFIDGNNWCLVLELLQGKNLKKYLCDLGILGIYETLTIFNQILSGVIACHEVGVVHRDLKPDNILITTNGAIKVLDFGIAIIDNFEVKKNEHQIIGTMKYIAPEIVKLEKPSEKSDIYSLGIILYELLTGQVPFFHINPQILASKHVKEPLPDPKELNPKLPELLVAVIYKATSKDPENRFIDVKTLQSILLKIQANLLLEKFNHANNPFSIIKKNISQEKILPFFLKKWFISLISIIIFSITILIIIIMLV